MYPNGFVMRQLLCRNIKLIAQNLNREGTNGNEVLWNTVKPGDFITQWLCLMSSSSNSTHLKGFSENMQDLKCILTLACRLETELCCMEGEAEIEIENTRTPPVAWGSCSPSVSSGSQEWARPTSLCPQTLQACQLFDNPTPSLYKFLWWSAAPYDKVSNYGFGNFCYLFWFIDFQWYLID